MNMKIIVYKMRITKKTIRDLALRSGGRCYYPGCRETLLDENSYFQAQTAHIISGSPHGPRYNPNKPIEYVNNIENLILLCYPHHRIIDEHEDKIWTTERLKDIKKKHEDEKFKEISLDNSSVRLITQILDNYFSNVNQGISNNNEIDELVNIPINEYKRYRKFSKVISNRIKSIDKFEEHIVNDEKEVPVIHNFFASFPWLLDPRIKYFENEVTYSNLLNKHFPDNNTIVEKNRRIDFFCMTYTDKILIFELKRPSRKVSHSDLDQALDYYSFIKSNLLSSPTNLNQVEVVLICGGIVDKLAVRTKADAYAGQGIVKIKTYFELLAEARGYHRDFIDIHNEYNEELDSI